MSCRADMLINQGSTFVEHQPRHAEWRARGATEEEHWEKVSPYSVKYFRTRLRHVSVEPCGEINVLIYGVCMMRYLFVTSHPLVLRQREHGSIPCPAINSDITLTKS